VAVADDEITTAKILNAAVTTAKIADANVTTAKIADANVTTAKLANGAVTQEKLNSSVTLVPTGAVMPFAMNSAPSGWLAANGAAVSRVTYAALFAAIGTTYGVGDGTTTFALPDLRGIFLRGSGSQTISGITYNKTFGAKETDENKAHRHFIVNDDGATDTIPTNSNFVARRGASTSFSTQNYLLTSTSTNPSLGLTSASGETETRPANIALLYCIKF
jgi:microcystin-dependent protein